MEVHSTGYFAISLESEDSSSLEAKPAQKTPSPKKEHHFFLNTDIPLSQSPFGKRRFSIQPQTKVRRELYKNDENGTPSCETNFDNLKNLDAVEIQKLILDRVDFCAEEIKTHLDRKIALYFSILLTCWNQKGLKFKIGRTEAQGQSAKSKHTRIDGHPIHIKMNAVHSSTLPCLYVCDLDAYLAWKQSKGTANPLPRPPYWIYLKNSGYYVNQNSTMNLPRFVNEGDIAVEGNKKDHKLRHAAIKIVNEVAQGLKTPSEGLNQFLLKFLEITSANLVQKNMEVSRTLQIFEEHIKETLRNFDENRFYSQFLGVMFYPEHSETLRTDIRKEMTSLNQICHEMDSGFRKEFSDLRNKAGDFLTADGKKRKRHKKPHGFDKFFMAHILNSYKNEHVKTSLHRLFCISSEELENLTKDSPLVKKKTDDLFQKNITHKELKDFKKSVKRLMNKKLLRLRVYQSNILNILMRERGVTADKLPDEFNHFFHQLSTPKKGPEVSEIPQLITEESLTKFLNMELDLSAEAAYQFAAFFNISPDVFLLDYSLMKI